MKKIIYIFIGILLFTSCKKDEFIHPDYLVFGAIQSDCNDVCRYVYFLDKEKLKEDSTVKYYSTKDLQLFKKTISNDKYLLAKDLIKKVPVDLINTNKTIFIDLNANSSNLWYAEIKLNGRIYSWTFDNAISSTPTYLKPFANDVIKTIQLIR